MNMDIYVNANSSSPPSSFEILTFSILIALLLAFMAYIYMRSIFVFTCIITCVLWAGYFADYTFFNHVLYLPFIQIFTTLFALLLWYLFYGLDRNKAEKKK